jgi:murein DD-endopeptidase MepM/ murein hydrolase activator NlpD
VLSKLVAKGEEYQKLLDAAEESEDALLDEMHKVETAYDKEYDRLKEEERKRKEEEERRRQEEALKNQLAQGNTGNAGNSDISTAVPSNATWKMPCSYIYLSSPYGYRIHPVYGTYRFHSGVDLAAPKGTPIYATRSGTVTRATYDSSSGYYVTINHGDGFSSSYLHMTHYIVKAGQKVKQGEVIGYVGSTGTSTGNHLHFSVYYNGTSQNPAAYIKFY